MKKIYKNRLPKDKEAKKVNVRVENGEVVVEVDLKDKFEPKDGDFLVSSCGKVFIYNGMNTIMEYGTYCGISIYDNIVINSFISSNWTGKDGCRYATSEEKTSFLKRLEKECHKRWNAEKKCLEDIYIPKFGDIVRIEHPEVDSFKRNYVISIFPNKEVPKKSVDCFFDIATVDMDGHVKIDDSHASYNHNHVYIASPSEKKELFDKLAEVGKRWNEETKQLEDIRWKPKMGETFYVVSMDGGVSKRVCELKEWYTIESCDCFRTKEAAQKVAEQIKEIFKNSKAE